MTDTAPPLTKHETVLVRSAAGYTSTSPYEVAQEVFTDDTPAGLQVTISRPRWLELGHPEQITVAIWGGDRLNDHPHTVAARTDAPVPDDPHTDMPCHG